MSNEEWYQNLCEKLAIPVVEESYHGFITTWELSEYYIRILKDYVDWYHLSSKQYFSIDFLREFKDYIKWGAYVDKEGIDENIYREFRKEIEEDMIEI